MTQRTVHDALTSLFAPRAIGLIGASASPNKLGYAMARSLEKFPGPVLLVNGRGDVPGTYRSVAEGVDATGTGIDLAILCVPATVTIDALRDAAKGGARAALLCSGGFAEIGPIGRELQDEVAIEARELGIRILGPNTSGFFVPAANLVASFVPGVETLSAGPVVIVAASGGVNHALAFAFAKAGIGIELAVGLGNSFDVSAADVLEHLVGDTRTRAVALHLESVTDGARLVDSVRRLTERTPVVALVVGRSDVGDFARSHTGSLASSWRVTRAALAQAGAVLVADERELVEATSALALLSPQPGVDPGVGIVTAQAGPGLLLLDQLQCEGVQVPTLCDETVATVGGLLPPMTYQRNPVDTGRPSEVFGDVIRAVGGDSAIDLVIVNALLEPTAFDLVQLLRDARSGGFEILASIGGPPGAVDEACARLYESGIPAFTTPTAAVAAVRALRQRARSLGRQSVDDAPVSNGRVPRLPEGASLDEREVKLALAAAGIAIPKHRCVTNVDEACRALDELGAPVVLKLLDAAVTHKSEIGGVHLGVASAEQMNVAFDALVALGAQRVLVEEMVPHSVELIVGARRDRVFGPVVMLGAGGVLTELLDDVAIRLVPAPADVVATMAGDLASAALFDGARGGPCLDREELTRAIRVMGELLVVNPELAELEVNPFGVTADGRLVALDAVAIFGRSDAGA